MTTQTPTVPVPQAKVICAWCRRVLRIGVLPASHGMCASCRETFEKEIA